MSEHHTTVTVNAPAHQVYEIFTHFNDFPKFMSFVKEVTYYDQRRSHWVAQVAGTHEWDAVNEDWVQDQQIGWRSTNGLQNSGRVKFTPLGAERTQVDVFISYTPPAGLLGAAVDSLGFDSRFDASLQKDLEHFARLVEQAPAGSLDPMQSHYIFHPDSAVAKGVLTERQQESMNNDPMMTPQELQTRNTEVERAKIEARQARQEQQEELERQAAAQQQAARDQEAALKRQAELDQQAERERAGLAAQNVPIQPQSATLGGRDPSHWATATGDQDARSARFPGHEQDPMISRAPGKMHTSDEPSVADTELESPWRTSMRGHAHGALNEKGEVVTEEEPQAQPHAEGDV